MASAVQFSVFCVINAERSIASMVVKDNKHVREKGNSGFSEMSLSF